MRKSCRATELQSYRTNFFLGVRKPELQSYRALTRSVNYKKATELQGQELQVILFLKLEIYEKLEKKLRKIRKKLKKKKKIEQK